MISLFKEHMLRQLTLRLLMLRQALRERGAALHPEARLNRDDGAPTPPDQQHPLISNGIRMHQKIGVRSVKNADPGRRSNNKRAHSKQRSQVTNKVSHRVPPKNYVLISIWTSYVLILFTSTRKWKIRFSRASTWIND